MASTALKELKKRLADLRRRLLPSRFSPIGSYSEAQRDRARGYTILAHAEIQAYLEEVVRGYAQRRRDEWSSLLAVAPGHTLRIQTAVIRPRLVQSILVASQQAVDAAISKNNGVKAYHLENLVRPLGLNIQAEFPALMTLLTAFGLDRNTYAHNGGFITLLDPKGEFESVKNIVVELSKFDTSMSA